MKYTLAPLAFCSLLIGSAQPYELSLDEMGLHIIQYGTLEQLNAFIDQFGHADYQFSDGQTLLHQAIRHQRTEFVIRLLQDYGNLIPLNAAGQTPLEYATQHSDYATFSLIFAQQRPHDPTELLTRALQWGTPAMVAHLFDKGVSPNHLLFNNNTPLHIAVLYERPELLPLLFSLKADVNACNNQSETPLMLAAGTRNYTVLKQLLKAGASIHLDDLPESVFHFLARVRKPRINAILLLLLQSNPSLDTLYDQNHENPLQVAIRHDNRSAVRRFLAAGAHPEAHHSDTKSPLSLILAQHPINMHFLRTLCLVGANTTQVIQHELEWPPLSFNQKAKKDVYRALKELIRRGACIHNKQQLKSLSKNQNRALLRLARQRLRTITALLQDDQQMPFDLVRYLMTFTDTPLPHTPKRAIFH